MSKPTVLVILDGFGLAPAGPGNAVALANTPNFDRYWSDCPHSQLVASGKSVGLPEGQMGNSEVGHLNLGAGRIVRQSLTHIDHLIETRDFFSNPQLLSLCQHCKQQQSALHLLGLVSDGGVHSSLDHVVALLELARQQELDRVYLHVFTDGRDTSPKSGAGFVAKLESHLGAYKIASVIGRYFAMDRDKRWDRVELAYRTLVERQAPHTAISASQAVEAAYQRGETDEFIQATVVEGGAPIVDGDALLFFNFRADRGRQLSDALMAPDFSGFHRHKVIAGLAYASFMNYGDSRPFAFELPPIRNCLAEVLSNLGLRQYHTAETEKYPHVTYFFNATLEKPFPGEERAMVASPKVATYDLQPQMSAPELTELTVKRILEQDDDFVLINFANPDMVGHTGVLSAAIAACEASDLGLGQIVQAATGKGGQVMIIADHGNAEKMIDDDGKPHTAHTTNLVPCVYVGPQHLRLRDGILGDVAPTLLALMGKPQPAEMTGQSLILPG